MADTIKVTVQRSAEWVKARRIETGRNVSDQITVDVDPSQLSLETRQKLIDYDGSYGTLNCICFSNSTLLPGRISGVAIARADDAPGRGGYYGEDIRVDADSPTVGQIDLAILDAFARIDARRAKRQQEEQQKEQEARRRAEARELVADEFRAKDAEIDRLQKKVDELECTIDDLKEQISDDD